MDLDRASRLRNATRIQKQDFLIHLTAYLMGMTKNTISAVAARASIANCVKPNRTFDK